MATDGWRRIPWVFFVLAALALALGIGLALGANAISGLDERADQNAAVAELNEERYDELAADNAALHEQLEDEGIDPVVPPPDEEPLPPLDEDVEVVPIGPTKAQVREVMEGYFADSPPPSGRAPNRTEVLAAFEDFCADGRCRGQNGTTPTDAEVLATFEVFCADGRCQGDTGDQGSQGDTGDQGLPGASAYEIWLSAGNTGTVSDFLAALKGDKGDGGQDGTDGRDGQDGADGVPGKDGAPGDPGRGIESITCPEDTDDWIVEYTDGTSETVPGPCRVEIGPPPPEETP